MKMRVHLKYIHPKYYESMGKMIDSVAKEKKFLARSIGPTFEQIESFAKNCIDRNLPYYVALHKGIVVGNITIEVAKSKLESHVGNVGMCIQKKFRHKGIGLKLVTKAIIHAFQVNKLSRIQLSVYTDNIPAISLYHKAGFTVDGIMKKRLKLNREFKDVIYMSITK